MSVLQRGWHARRHIPGAGAHARLRGHPRRAGEAARAARDEHVAGGELGRARAPCAAAARARSARSSPTEASPGAPRGMPMSSVCTSPAWALPGRIHSPGLAAWKVTVSEAHTAAPRTTPVDASTPLGTSTLTTDARAALIAAIDAATAPRGSPWKPVPSSASIDAHVRAEQLCRGGHRRLHPLVLRRPRRAVQAHRRRAGEALEVRACVARELRRRRHAHDRHGPGPTRAGGVLQRARRRRCCPCRRRPSPARPERGARAPVRRRRLRAPSARGSRPPVARSPSGRSRASSRRREAGRARRVAGSPPAMLDGPPIEGYSTVTVLARLRGWSTFRPRPRAIS